MKVHEAEAIKGLSALSTSCRAHANPQLVNITQSYGALCDGKQFNVYRNIVAELLVTTVLINRAMFKHSVDTSIMNTGLGS